MNLYFAIGELKGVGWFIMVGDSHTCIAHGPFGDEQKARDYKHHRWGEC